jgi:hypothetical protein
MTPARRRPLGRAVLATLALFIVALVASPLLHHDLGCQQKAAGHCAACHMGRHVARAAEAQALPSPALREAPARELPALAGPQDPTAPAEPGRAPPAPL